MHMRRCTIYIPFLVIYCILYSINYSIVGSVHSSLLSKGTVPFAVLTCHLAFLGHPFHCASILHMPNRHWYIHKVWQYKPFSGWLSTPRTMYQSRKHGMIHIHIYSLSTNIISLDCNLYTLDFIIIPCVYVWIRIKSYKRFQYRCGQLTQKVYSPFHTRYNIYSTYSVPHYTRHAYHKHIKTSHAMYAHMVWSDWQ